MGTTFGGRLSRLALCLIAAFAMALMFVAGVGVEGALADDSADNSLKAGEMLAAGENDAQLVEYPLWVGGAQVTSKNLEGQGWSFDPGAKTLTLNGYIYKGAGHEESALDDDGGYQIYRHSPVFWNDEESAITIELKGENDVTVTGGSEHGDVPDRYYGVFSAGGLAFKGAGSLATDAGGIEQPDDDSDAAEPEAAGIYARRDIAIDGGSISATGYNSGIESYDGTIAIGKGAGKVTAKTTAPTNWYPYAIYAEDGGVRIDGGSVTAIGFTGIYTAQGIVVNGGDIIAQTNAPDTFDSIVSPSGIDSENAQVIVNGGSVNAKGVAYGIYSGFRNNKDDDDEDDEGSGSGEVVVNGVIVNGGSVVAEATGPKNEEFNTGFGIGVDGDGGGAMTVAGGSVQAIASGKDGCGISAPNSITIKEGITSLVATGTGGAFTKDTNVKNAIAGLGWTNVEGAVGKTVIEANTAGQTLDGFKRALFPAPVASVKTPPSEKKLTYSGKPQELVAAGEAVGGEMQYSLDGKAYDAKLPTATEVGDYTVYYKVVGDESHTDSEVKTVTSAIVAKTADTGKSSTAKTGDAVAYAIPVVVALAALAAVVIALVAKRRTRD